MALCFLFFFVPAPRLMRGDCLNRGSKKKKGQAIQTGVVLSRSCCGKSFRGGGADTLAIELRCSDGNECRLWWTEIEVHGCTAPVVYLVKAKQVFLRIYQHGVVLMRIAIAWPCPSLLRQTSSYPAAE